MYAVLEFNAEFIPVKTERKRFVTAFIAMTKKGH